MNKNIRKIAIIGLLLSSNTLNYITAVAVPMEQTEISVQADEESNSLEKVILNIQEYDNSIEEKMDKLEKLQKELDAKSEEIKVNEENIGSLEKDVEERDKLLAERLKEVQNSGGLKVTPLKYMEAIFNSKNLLDAINNLNSIYKICKNDAELIEEAKEAKETLENIKVKILDDKKQLEEDTEYVKEELSKLEEEKAKLIKYIEENSELLNVTNGTIVPIELPDGISELTANLINTAQRYLGVPYLWGGTTPSGFDCSGLMQYVFAKENISIPRTSQEQQKASEPIDINDVEPGDLVFNKESGATHVGMYIGNGLYIHAPHTGDVVKISTLSTSNMKYAGKVIEQ